MNRVVITGMGAASPVGCGVEAFWHGLTTGSSGIGPITLFDASAMPVRIGGEVSDLDCGAVVRQFPAAAGDRDRKVLLGLAAAAEAVAGASVTPEDLRSAALHLAMGLEVFSLGDITPHAGAADIAASLARAALADGAGDLLQTPLDRLADVLGQRWPLRGGRWVNCSACAAGAQVIGDAFDLLRSGQGEIALVGAADSMLNPLGMGGFSLLRVLSDDNEHPGLACRPFDANRRGAVLGEGAGFVVLETLDRAAARGAEIHAEVLGYGSSMDAYRVSDPDPDGAGARMSMHKALADADLTAGDVDCVSAHGTGTPKNDAVETAAIEAVLGPRAYEIPVHAVKSMTGHMIAASGTIEAVAAALTLSRRLVPPTINLETPDPECDLDYVSDGPREFAGRRVLSNSFGFGGQNATLILGRYD